MLQKFPLSKLICGRQAFNPATGQSSLIGADFVYDWERVRNYAREHRINLDSFLVLPIAARLFEKKLRSTSMFWYTPLNDLFVITVCSAANVDFMNPLHELPGYTEYGESFLRPHARPMVLWHGGVVYRTHLLLSNSASDRLVADFGNGFGLTVTPADATWYEQVLETPQDHFEYLAVPQTRRQNCDWNGRRFTMEHVLCMAD